MAGRRLSIFQMLKDLKDTVSPVNPSSSDGPSSIFYVSSDGPDCSDSRTNWSIEDNNCYFAADSCRAADYYDQQEQVLELVDSLKSLEEGAGDSDKRAASIQGNKSSAEAPVGLDNKSPIASATPTPFQSMDELDRILQATFPDSSQTNNSAENNGASDNNIVTKKKSKSKSILGTAAAAAWKFKRRDSKRAPSSAADQFGDFSNTTSSTAAATEQNDPSVGPLSLESDYCNQVVHRRRSSVAKKLFKRKSKCDSTDSSGSSGGAFGLSSSLSSGLGSGSTISFSSEVSSGMTGKGSARSSTSSETLSDVFNWNFLQKLKFKVSFLFIFVLLLAMRLPQYCDLGMSASFD